MLEILGKQRQAVEHQLADAIGPPDRELAADLRTGVAAVEVDPIQLQQIQDPDRAIGVVLHVGVLARGPGGISVAEHVGRHGEARGGEFGHQAHHAQRGAGAGMRQVQRQAPGGVALPRITIVDQSFAQPEESPVDHDLSTLRMARPGFGGCEFERRARRQHAENARSADKITTGDRTGHRAWNQ